MAEHATRAAVSADVAPAPKPSSILQRTCSCGQRVTGGGECDACKDKRAQIHSYLVGQRRIQTKLAIGATGDAYEREADHIAELATRGMPLPPISPLAEGSAEIARESFDPDEAPGTVGAGLEAQLHESEGRGAPLAGSARERFEDRFGADFSAVRVHADTAANRINDALDAVAFTHGRDIYFSSGSYRPGTLAGDRLLAHELTHVVQQAGGAPQAQRVQRYEQKPYRGTNVHKGMEERLRAKNDALVTEAPIPGATTNKLEVEVLGSADLYKSSLTKKVSGVRGTFTDEQRDFLPAQQRLDYIPVTDARAMTGATAAEKQPTVTRGSSAFSGNLPAKFWVADIKPLDWITLTNVNVKIGGKIGEGTVQIGNYMAGFPRFAERAHRDTARTGVTSGQMTGDRLKGLTIPPGLDYKTFKTEAAKTTPSEGHWVVGDSRYWLHEIPNLGLYVYFTLPHPYQPTNLKTAIDNVIKSLKPVTQDLREGVPRKKVDPNRKTRVGKRKPRGARRIGPQPRVVAPKRPARVQRQKTPTGEWEAARINWEMTKRKPWDDTHAKPFLSSKEGKAIGRQVSVDKAFGLVPATAGGAQPIGKQYKSVEKWSGISGEALGRGRYLLAGSFDKVIVLYDGIAGRMNSLTGPGRQRGYGGGWKGALIQALVAAAKLGFDEVLTAMFRIFANCFNAVIDRVIDEFTNELEEEFAEELKELHAKFDEFHDRFIATFNEHFGSWQEFLKTLEDVQKWGTIISGVVDLIRVIIQAVSCLSPPAAGCLWGLVANLAAEVALEIGVPLILDTQRFREEIVQPTVQDLLKDVAGEQIQDLMGTALGAAKLDRYLTGPKKVDQCRVAREKIDLSKAINAQLPPALTEEQLKARRDTWQTDKENALIKAAKPALQTSTGATPTNTDIDALITAMQRSNLPYAQLKVIFESSKDPTTGKHDIRAIRSGLEPTPTHRPPFIAAVRGPRRGSGRGPSFGPFTPIPPAGGDDRRSGPSVGGGLTIPLPLP